MADFRSQVHEAISPHLNAKDRIKLAQLLSKFSNVFDDKLDTCNVTSHEINIGRSTPITQRPQRLPYAYRDEADQQIKEMLANGIIAPRVSPWSSPIVLVRKKNSDLRFRVDYCKLNQITVNDSHPLLLISDLLDGVKDTNILVCLIFTLVTGRFQLHKKTMLKLHLSCKMGYMNLLECRLDCKQHQQHFSVQWKSS